MGSSGLQVVEEEIHTADDIRGLDRTPRDAVFAKKFYAVRRGCIPKLYFNWHDCQKEVKGFINSKFQSFKSLQEAQRYLRGV